MVVNPRTWPFLKEGDVWTVDRVFCTGEWVKLVGQPYTVLETQLGPQALVEWIPADSFKEV